MTAERHQKGDDFQKRFKGCRNTFVKPNLFTTLLKGLIRKPPKFKKTGFNEATGQLCKSDTPQEGTILSLISINNIMQKPQ